MNPFRQLLLAHGAKVPIGTWVSSASPVVAEAVGCAGFDWGVLDMEHAPVDVMQLLQLLQWLQHLTIIRRAVAASCLGEHAGFGKHIFTKA